MYVLIGMTHIKWATSRLGHIKKVKKRSQVVKVFYEIIKPEIDLSDLLSVKKLGLLFCSSTLCT